MEPAKLEGPGLESITMNAEVGPDGRAQFAESPTHVPGKSELALALQRHLQTELVPLAK